MRRVSRAENHSTVCMEAIQRIWLSFNSYINSFRRPCMYIYSLNVVLRAIFIDRFAEWLTACYYLSYKIHQHKFIFVLLYFSAFHKCWLWQFACNDDDAVAIWRVSIKFTNRLTIKYKHHYTKRLKM